MRLRIYYPVAYLLIVGMVFYALKPGLERAQAWRKTLDAIPQAGLAIDGAGLRAIVVNERASVELHASEADAAAPYVVIGSSGVVTNDDNNGAHYFVPPEAVRELRGVEVDVAFEVRAAPEGGSLEWLARAVIPDVLDTGWSPLPAREEWTTASLHIAIPEGDVMEPMGLMMWSDAKGDGGRVELRRIFIRPAGLTQNAQNLQNPGETPPLVVAGAPATSDREM